MNESSENGRQPNEFLDHWCNDEIPIEMGPQYDQPPQPITGKRLENLKAERALRARLDPKYRAHLESRGIFLTPEELQPPTSSSGEVTPS
jgi:hypothetical protein